MPKNPYNNLCLTILMDLNFPKIFGYKFGVIFPWTGCREIVPKVSVTRPSLLDLILCDPLVIFVYL